MERLDLQQYSTEGRALMRVASKVNEIIDELAKREEPTQPKERWRADRNEKYWYLHTIGVVGYALDDRRWRDDWLYKTGNYYRTQEDAKVAMDKILAS